MLIDLHAHSSGISQCCRIPYAEVLKQALDNGMDGIVLTNHYQKSYLEDGDADAFAQKYIAEFYAAEQCGRQIGCRVFFGIEVTTELYPKVHMLVYGVDPEFLLEHPCVFDYTQKELYELVHAHNGILVQAHPFRYGEHLLDPALMDGVEINCHPLYGNSYSERVLQIAEDHQLIVTCGGDYHADTYRPKCGMFLPDACRDHHDLKAYLQSTQEKALCIQEPNTDEHIRLPLKAFH